jgi:hypothetical protein
MVIDLGVVPLDIEKWTERNVFLQHKSPGIHARLDDPDSWSICGTDVHLQDDKAI